MKLAQYKCNNSSKYKYGLFNEKGRSKCCIFYVDDSNYMNFIVLGNYEK